MKKPDASLLSDLRSAVQQGRGSKRSPLFRWMYENHDELVDMLDQPNWTHVTELLGSRGFTGPDGRELKPETVRKLWLRVRQAHDKAQAGKKPKPAAKPVGAMPVVHEASSPATIKPPEDATVQPSDTAAKLAKFRSKINRHSGRAE
jgi:hypothetical protein